jgi:hypothetical protein
MISAVSVAISRKASIGADGGSFAQRCRLDHDRREQRQPRGMHDRRDDAAPLLPGLAIADEQPVAEERREGMTHLRRLAFETVVQRNESLRHRLRAVAHEQLAVEDPGGKELVLEAFLVEHSEKVAASHPERRNWPQGLGRARRIRRHEARRQNSHLARIGRKSNPGHRRSVAQAYRAAAEPPPRSGRPSAEPVGSQ